ncbi:MAG: arsenic transporter [Xanthobacteraceae bacterium]
MIPDLSSAPHVVIWIIAALAVAGMIVRPFQIVGAVWPVGGAAILLVFGLISPRVALTGVAKGTDVYLFLTGMMLLAEVARNEGLFDWLAALATSHAKGSADRLFLLIYLVGTAVTILLSNDATAVVLTPAVAAAARTAKVEEPLPYLLICAFIANAASFVLPISNPANLVLYGSHMPPLGQWLPQFLLASVLSIVVTYVVLKWTQRTALHQRLAQSVPVPALSGGGKIAAAGIAATAIVLLGASALDMRLGLPTCMAGVLTAVIVLIRRPPRTWLAKAGPVLKDISWGILPLVAGLFVLVEAMNQTGLIANSGMLLHDAAARSAIWAGWGAGVAAALGSNLANNLPVGLIASSAVHAAGPPDQVTSAILIGVDLGPNLSVTGSLATILWLTALRREGQTVGAAKFLALGMIVMPAALLASIAATVLL